MAFRFNPFCLSPARISRRLTTKSQAHHFSTRLSFEYTTLIFLVRVIKGETLWFDMDLDLSMTMTSLAGWFGAEVMYCTEAPAQQSAFMYAFIHSQRASHRQNCNLH